MFGGTTEYVVIYMILYSFDMENMFMRCVWSLLKKTTYRTMIMWRLARSSNKLKLKLSFGSVWALRNCSDSLFRFVF